MIAFRSHTRYFFWCFLAAAGLLVASGAFAQSMSYSGELGPGDTKLGRYFDTYPLQLTAGDRIVAILSSYDFDAYLHLESPGGREIENDDYSEGSEARIDALIDVSGTWKVKVTSYEEGEQGEYLLTIVRENLQELNSYTGMLDERDSVSVKGEFYDGYYFQVERNQRVIVSLQSEQFDPFLVLKPPRGRRMVNDDYQTEGESRIDFFTEIGGRYEVFATSYTGGEQGEYSLRILLGDQMNVREISGVLDLDDPELEEYGFYEIHTLFLEAGDHVILEMISEDLDTLLMVEGPNGFYAENDDHNEQTFISRIELFAQTDGQYSITTASYDAGVEGRYTLKIYSSGISGILMHNLPQLAMIDKSDIGRF